jgi:GNAT superfamily N-acetyltransferase
MRIERIDAQADKAGLATCYEIFEGSRLHDDPRRAPMGPERFRDWWAYGFGSQPRQVWLATEPGGPVGCYLLELPEQENAHLGECVLLVPPGARRRGVGTALLTHCAEQARRAGRTHLSGDVMQDTGAEVFAAAMGVSFGLAEIRYHLEIDAGLAGRLARLRAQAEPAADGYELLRWAGATPDEYLDQVARVNGAMSDAPRDARREPRRWDADRVREADEGLLKRGLGLYAVAARRVGSAELAGLTQMLYDPETPGWGFQGLTAVVGPHRGHRLGLLLKVAMLEWIPELGVDVRRMPTWNSLANAHMTEINMQLGYRETGRFRSWELPVAGPGAAGG